MSCPNCPRCNKAICEFNDGGWVCSYCGYGSELTQAQDYINELEALVMEMVPHLKYLLNITILEKVPWMLGKKTRKSIVALINRPEVQSIMKEKLS